MRVRLSGFQGMFPRRDPRLLDPQHAQLARDARLLSGAIEAYQDYELVEPDVTLEGLGTEAIYKWRQGENEEHWFRFPSHVDVVRGPTAGDVWERVYWTGDSRYDWPVFTYAGPATETDEPPSTAFRIGIEAPDDVITGSRVQPEAVDVDSVEMARPMVVTTDEPHGLEDDTIVRFNISADEPDGDDEIDLAEFLNDSDGYQIRVIDDTQFSLNGTDGENQGYSDFQSGTVEAYWAPEDMETRFYTHTYVNELGEEGPPGPASNSVVAGADQPVELNLPPLTFSEGKAITRRRIYRTATGDQGADFQFVDEVSVGQSEYTDATPTRNLAEVLPSTEYDPPPEDMQGLNVLPSGVMVGFVEQDLCFSEPYLPHAWPTSYRLTLDFPIVAVGVFDQYVVVGTEAQPYIVAGGDPRAMQPQRLALTQGCVSKRSMANMGYGCAYASADGLVLVTNQGAEIVTRGVLSPREWEEYAPETIHAYELDGRYVGFFDNGERKGGFIFDPRAPDNGFQEIDFWAKDGHRDPKEPRIYLLTEDNDIVRWDAADDLRPYTWRSKLIPFTYRVNLSCARVVARSYDDLEFRLYAGGELRHAVAVTSSEPFRLPTGYTALNCEIEVQGTDTVQEIVLADNMEELAQP